ncbi:5-oxoprolinase subunit PxpA [Christiangramia sp. OXR-203]|uniref:5-oxoprolinase subunit PxpA n=1 Tax=Christiangramia sp. OXR-203 TaxID=3100176 RepID=UPI002AC9DAC5|nr:5-oxoprolinase subunit PxpA [Christiangramia sp. OXR-203]WPY99619.1 5-oxoprolinase subunit PxpA [Christiangramia sp. OXR-203]
MMKQTIHINCDLGEGGEFDEKLMPLISACNIACGGHAGNLETMHRTVRLALENNVEIGAHPSYPDRANFGRNHMEMTAEELKLSIEGQVLSLKQIVESEGGKLSHVKLHGALYNDAAKDRNISKVVMRSLEDLGDDFRLFVPVNSQLGELALGRFELYYEAFADRNYEKNYGLVPRSKSHAIIEDRKMVFQHVRSIYNENKILLQNGEFLEAQANTFCVHSDTPSAVEILQYLQRKLAAENIYIKS